MSGASTSEVSGVRLASAACGLKRAGGPDLLLIELAEGTESAAVFTRNAFCAAPVQVARRHLGAASPRALLVNSGNANAGTGEAGLAAAGQCAIAVARELGCAPASVLPFSTGVIGEPLAVAKIEAALPGLVDRLETGGWEDAARAIMTTDTRPKLASRRIALGARQIAVTGIAKGAGMIRPNMATMLAFVACDAAVERAALRDLLDSAVRNSFNRITVDGDTSTNDACTLSATGAAGVALHPGNAHWPAFADAVHGLFVELATALVRDAEGATKFITLNVRGGADQHECERVAYAVAESPLVKTAFFASDANWGRILAAVGRAGVADLDVSRVAIDLDDVAVVRGGGRAESYTEQSGQAVMSREDIRITIDLGRGAAEATVWTCDLSHDYVRINAEYRT